MALSIHSARDLLLATVSSYAVTLDSAAYGLRQGGQVAAGSSGERSGTRAQD